MIIGVSGKIGSGKDLVGEIIQYLTSVYKNGYYEGEYKERKDLPSIKKYSMEQWKNQSVPTNLTPFKIKKYADKLKDIVCILIGCTREQFEDRVFKETELGEEWWYYEVSMNKDKLIIQEDYKLLYKNIIGIFFKLEDIPDKYYNNENASGFRVQLIKPTPRLLLQLLGTECGRQIIHPNIWVNATMVNYKQEIISKEITKIGFEVIGNYPDWIITDVRFPNEAKAITDRDGINIRINRPDAFNLPNDGTGIKTRIESNLHPSETSLDNYEFDYIINNDGSIEELIEKVKIILILEGIL